jgi:hypothetical protein
MALEVALRCGLPADYAERAAALMGHIPGYDALDAEDGGSSGSGGSIELGDGQSEEQVQSAEEEEREGGGRSDLEAAHSSNGHSTGSSAAAGAGAAVARAAVGPKRGGSSSSPGIAAAEPIMSDVISWLVDSSLLLDGGGAADGNGSSSARQLPRVERVSHGFQPQPSNAGRSCIYVVRWMRSKFFYAGCTNNIYQRYTQHVRSGGPLEMIYVALDSGGGGGGDDGPNGGSYGAIGGVKGGGGSGGGGGGSGGGQVAVLVSRAAPLLADGALAAAEGELIRRLRDAGLPMASTHDARRKRRAGP